MDVTCCFERNFTVSASTGRLPLLQGGLKTIWIFLKQKCYVVGLPFPPRRPLYLAYHVIRINRWVVVFVNTRRRTRIQETPTASRAIDA